jgi:hypothetical protein
MTFLIAPFIKINEIKVCFIFFLNFSEISTAGTAILEEYDYIEKNAKIDVS